MKDRKIQIEEKQQLLHFERVREDRWNTMLNQQLSAADEREKEMEQRVLAKNAKMAQDQQQQLEEFKNRYIDQLREEKREGERIKAKALKDMEDEADQERRRRLRAKQANEGKVFTIISRKLGSNVERNKTCESKTSSAASEGKREREIGRIEARSRCEEERRDSSKTKRIATFERSKSASSKATHDRPCTQTCVFF